MKVAVVTGTRAEYGLLKKLMRAIHASDALALQVVATGTHLSPEYGQTEREIVADGFAIDWRVEMLVSGDTDSAITKSAGLALIGFSEAWGALKPNLAIILGDRYEALACATACLLHRIPIAHIHGGEVTTGAVDDAIRHAITKMASIHFAAAEPYRNRIIQMGEDPKRVFNIGGMGVDAIRSAELLTKASLESEIGFKFGTKNLMVTFHPATLESESPEFQFGELLAALDDFDGHLLFTMPNADHGRSGITHHLAEFVDKNAARSKVFHSLGSRRYLSCLQFVDGVVGNSSSGLLEAPSFHIGTVNIGSRQQGRLKAASVIDCEPRREAIGAAIAKLYDPSFQSLLKEVRNPYGNGTATEQIMQILVQIDPRQLVVKEFCDR